MHAYYTKCFELNPVYGCTALNIDKPYKTKCLFLPPSNCLTHTAGDLIIYQATKRRAGPVKASENMQEPTFIIEVRGGHSL